MKAGTSGLTAEADEVARLRLQLAAAEHRARASHGRQRLILDSAIDYAIVALDLDGLVTEWNEGACRILGWTEAEMLGQSAGVFFTPEDRVSGIFELELRAAAALGRGNDERWHLRKDGSRFWASGEMMPLTDEAGALLGFIKVLRDRTSQRDADEKNRADAEFLRSVLASSGDCIKVLDLDTRILFMNEAGMQLMEVGDFGAIRGCPFPDFWRGQGNVDAWAAVEIARSGGVGRFHGPANTLAGRPRWWDVQVTPIFGSDGKPERLLSVSRDVTEMQEARERIELALNTDTVIGTWMWDIQRDRVTGDGRFARSLGLEATVLAAGVPIRRVLDCIHPEDRPDVEARLQRATSSGGGCSAEYRVRQESAGWLWVVANGHCEMGPDERPLQFPGILLNIDRRKRHELRQAALLELGERLRALRHTGDIAEMAVAAAEIVCRTLNVPRAGYGRIDAGIRMVTVDRDWRADPSILSIAGSHRFDDYGSLVEQLLRGETVSISDVEHDPRTRGAVGRLLDLPFRALLNVPLIHEGELVAALLLNDTAKRVWTEDEIVFAHAVADRTWAAKEQALAEARLRQLNETLEAQVIERTHERDRLWELSENLLVVADFEGRLLRVSRSWTRLLGHSETLLLTRPYSAIIHPDDLGSVRNALREMQASGRAARYETRMACADGSWRWIAWTLSAERDGEQMLGIGRDITEERAASANQARLEEQLRQSQKMEAVGQLTGGLAHDFNNLLTGITGSLELLQTRVADGRLAEIDRYVGAAQGAAKRAAALTHRLLAFSRRQTLEPKATDANRLMSGMEELIRRTVGPEITLETVGGPDLWHIRVDPGQLENALLNLCINARDAMPDGGRLRIETANHWLDSRAAEERDLPPGAYVSLCVQDDGTGMTEEVIARAFDPFFTTKPIGQGTGLGLSMIYGFVRQSGGQATIASQPGEGSTVCIILPRHLGPLDEADPRSEPTTAPRAEQGETVLVVDDEPTIRLLVTEVLEDLGYTAIEAADGSTALTVLQADVRVDLLVTDVGLPGGINGRQVADAARVLRPQLKVLFITGYAENAVLSHGNLDPGMYVLTKPFALEALASRIKDLIRAV